MYGYQTWSPDTTLYGLGTWKILLRRKNSANAMVAQAFGNHVGIILKLILLLPSKHPACCFATLRCSMQRVCIIRTIVLCFFAWHWLMGGRAHSHGQDIADQEVTLPLITKMEAFLCVETTSKRTERCNSPSPTSHKQPRALTTRTPRFDTLLMASVFVHDLFVRPRNRMRKSLGTRPTWLLERSVSFSIYSLDVASRFAPPCNCVASSNTTCAHAPRCTSTSSLVVDSLAFCASPMPPSYAKRAHHHACDVSSLVWMVYNGVFRPDHVKDGVKPNAPIQLQIHPTSMVLVRTARRSTSSTCRHGRIVVDERVPKRDNAREDASGGGKAVGCGGVGVCAGLDLGIPPGMAQNQCQVEEEEARRGPTR